MGETVYHHPEANKTSGSQSGISPGGAVADNAYDMLPFAASNLRSGNVAKSAVAS